MCDIRYLNNLYNSKVNHQMNAISSLKINRGKVSIASLQDQSGDKAYWLSQTPYQRLKAVETLRQINYGYHKSTARLQRILEIAERAPG